MAITLRPVTKAPVDSVKPVRGGLRKEFGTGGRAALRGAGGWAITAQRDRAGEPVGARVREFLHPVFYHPHEYPRFLAATYQLL